jgi:hypothetical protein
MEFHVKGIRNDDCGIAFLPRPKSLHTPFIRFRLFAFTLVYQSFTALFLLLLLIVSIKRVSLVSMRTRDEDDKLKDTVQMRYGDAGIAIEELIPARTRMQRVRRWRDISGRVDGRGTGRLETWTTNEGVRRIHTVKVNTNTMEGGFLKLV